MSPAIGILFGVGLIVAIVVIAALVAHMANLRTEAECWKNSAAWWRGLYQGRHPWPEKRAEDPVTH